MCSSSRRTPATPRGARSRSSRIASSARVHRVAARHSCRFVQTCTSRTFAATSAPASAKSSRANTTRQFWRPPDCHASASIHPISNAWPSRSKRSRLRQVRVRSACNVATRTNASARRSRQSTTRRRPHASWPNATCCSSWAAVVRCPSVRSSPRHPTVTDSE